MKDYTPKFYSLLERYSHLIKEQDEQQPETQLPDATQPEQQVEQTPEQPQQTPEAETETEENPTKATEGYAYLTNIIYNLLTLPSESLPKEVLTLSDEKIENTKQSFSMLNKLVELLPADLRIQILKANFGGSGSLGLSDQDMIEMSNVALRALFYSDKLSNEFTGLKDDIKSEITKSGGKITTDNANMIYSRIKELVGVEVDTQE